jgi:methylglutaconyl-CoA hydratase
MSESLVLSSLSGCIAYLTLNRPQKRNALTRELLSELLSQLREIRTNAKARVLILAGAGPVFTAGMDLVQMQEAAEAPDAKDLWRRDAQLYRDILWELFSLPVPTLALIQGAAVAGGVGLVAACDIVLASESAVFALPEPSRGITAAMVTPLLTYRVGPGAAGCLLLSGHTLSSREAHEVGLVHKVVDDDELAESALAWAQLILKGAPEALAATKSFLIECAGAQLRAQLDLASEGAITARESPAAREGLAAFLEKRLPSWQHFPSH